MIYKKHPSNLGNVYEIFNVDLGFVKNKKPSYNEVLNHQDL